MPIRLVDSRDMVHQLARILLFLLAALVFLTLIGGCSHQVNVRGVLIEDTPVAPPRSIWIESSPEAPEQDATLKPKIGSLLEKRGYRVVGKDEAELVLLYDSSIESLTTKMFIEPISGGKGGIATVSREGPYDRSLSLRLIQAAAFRQDATEDIVWAGAALLHGAPTESSKFDDLLLVALFKYFPNDTGKTVVVKLSVNSPAARKLHKLGHEAEQE